MLVTMGGASVGDYDLVQKALAAEGMELSFWKIAMRPGRPLMHGRLGGMQCSVCRAIRSRPSSARSCFWCRCCGALPAAADARCREPNHALLGRDLPENDERADYLRARLSRSTRGALVATPLPLQDSSMMRCWRRPIAWSSASHMRLRGARRVTLRYPKASPLANPRFSSPQIKGLRNTYRTYSVRS